MKRDLVFLSHCMPYPPDKGEKIRAWNIIRHLARTHRVHLGCVVTTESDMAHLDTVRGVCASVGAFRIDPFKQRLRALLHARPGRPLMPDCYTSPALRRWVDRTVAEIDPALIMLYTVAMAPHALHLPHRKLLDAVDIDSEKWTEYATHARLPMRAVWAREGRTLLAYERRVAAACEATLFVSPQEAQRFALLAPELACRIDWVENGVELDRFSPTRDFASPFDTPGPHLVFTGHMDYWPNEDAVTWFAQDILPRIRETSLAQFWIVGANPTAKVLALASIPGVHVTGRVPDTRPYLAHAQAAICPLRLARGIQNKVLEAMAMGRPVIASHAAFEGVRAQPGQDLLVAGDAADFAAAVLAILAGAHAGLGEAARRAMKAKYAWDATLARLDARIETAGGKDG
jgi:sugar transferase (PEP-CTERM/EpsH1 system associated)